MPLSNGRRLSTVAQGYQYQFDLESALDLPGDTPGELRLPHLDPVRVSVVAFEGLSITLNSERDLGAFVPFATLQSNLSMLLLKLIERIEKKSTSPNPAGERLLGKCKPAGDAHHVSNEDLGLSADAALNPEQLVAVGSVLGRDTTYIWGPPGTGKTHTIGAIGAMLFKRGQSLLVVSHTNTAVDGAVLQIASAVRGFAAAELESGSVVRVGTPKDGRLMAPENSALLLSEQRERRLADLAARKELLTAERDPLHARERDLALLVQLHEWLAEAEPDATRISHALSDEQRLRSEVESLRVAVREAEASLAQLRITSKSAEAALWAKQHEHECDCRRQTLVQQRDELRRQLTEAEVQSTALEREVVTARQIQPLRDELGRGPSPAEATRSLTLRVQEEAILRAQLERDQRGLHDAERLLADTCMANWMTRKWRGLPEPEPQQAVVARCQGVVTMATEALSAVTAGRQEAEAAKANVERLAAALEPLTQ